MTESDEQRIDDLFEQRIEDLYHRMLRLKPWILALPREPIEAAVRDCYDNKPARTPLKLGEGTAHRVYNVGSIRDGEREIYLALRLPKGGAELFEDDDYFSFVENEIVLFELAYAIGERVPFLIGACTFPEEWTIPVKTDARVSAVIVEDVTAANKYRLMMRGYTHAIVFRDDGERSYFIDPFERSIKATQEEKQKIMKYSKAKHYLSDARVDF